MEPHKVLNTSIEAFRPPLTEGPHAYFEKAYAFAKTFYDEQMQQIWAVDHKKVEPEFFFREYIWVVHATGFSAKAVGKFMPRLLVAYGSYGELAKKDVRTAVNNVKPVCNNPQKISAIHKTSKLMDKGIRELGWDAFKQTKLSTPKQLEELPYVGPVTCFHLARNIGLLDCVKPDLHLIRLAEHWGFSDCVAMCQAMGQGTVLPLGIVDLVVWYAASTFGTLDIRKEGTR